MADLPDIDTSTVSFLAYWNAIDDGGIAEADMDPASVTTYGSISSYTLYDNGVQGKLPSPTTDPCQTYFRVKSDGWIVVWCTRDVQYNTQVRDGSTFGPWEAMGTRGVPSEGPLQQEIQSLHSNLSTTGNFLFSDVGLYNYEHSSASTLSLFASSGTFTYTSGTNLHHAVAAARIEDQYNADGSNASFTGENGSITLANTGGSEQYVTESGSRDLLLNGDIANSATEYSMSSNDAGGPWFSNFQILWS